ncbi:MAG: laccase domain-containing protein [Gemmatimonadetes bacterium]|nr:laccase domain-containing protein [Gemmatimonadota bacterium]
MRHRAASTSFRVVFESVRDPLPVVVHDGWVEAFPWLVQGTTTSGRVSPAGEGAPPFDLGLFSDGSAEAVVRRNWRTLAQHLDATAVVHAPQPHGCVVRVWPGSGATEDGVAGGDGAPQLVDPCDGHVTRQPGVVVAVTVADCVPVSLVDPKQRVVAMVHAGWRSAAAGILELALETMTDRFGTRTDDVHVHLGPAICGACYEVGPEVHEALGQQVPSGPEPIDLRGVLGRRALEYGAVPDRTTVSGHCTLCGEAGLFSHRGGDAQRQVGFLGIRG